MLKLAKIIQPGSVKASDMGHDMAAAAAINLPPERRGDFIALNEGIFANIAQAVLAYNMMYSGGVLNSAKLSTRRTLEDIGEEIQGEVALQSAPEMPQTVAEIPTDRAGITALLSLADKNPGLFDTGLVEKLYNMLAPAAPTHPHETTFQQTPGAAEAKAEELKQQTRMPKLEQKYPALEKPWAESSLHLTAADDAATLQQVHDEMVQSGQFSYEQRNNVFSDRLVETFLSWEDMVTQEKLAREVAHAGNANIREEKERSKQEEEARLEGLLADEVSIADMSPSMRARVEQRQAEKADVQAREKAKAAEKEESRKELFRGVSKLPNETAGLEEYLRNLEKLLIKKPKKGGEEDEELRASFQAYAESLRYEAEKSPATWQNKAKDLIRQFPDLMDLAEEKSGREEQYQYERKQKQEYKPPHKPPQEMVPESQKADELPPGVFIPSKPLEKPFNPIKLPPKPEREEPEEPEEPIAPTSALITKNQEYDAMKGEGPWLLDKEAKAIRRRKVMVQNAMFGRPPVPYAIGDTVGFTRGSALDSGKIVAIKAHDYILETSKGQVAVNHDAIFEPAQTDLF